MNKEDILNLKNEVSPKAFKILEMRNGLNDGIQHTLESVGKEFGVTRERIRQIEAKMYEKIRQQKDYQFIECPLQEFILEAGTPREERVIVNRYRINNDGTITFKVAE